MPRTKAVSVKSTKQDILAAYEDLLTQVAATGEAEPALAVAGQKPEQIDKMQQQLTAQIAQLHATLSQSVQNIFEQLQQGTKTLQALAQAQQAVQEQTQVEQARVKKQRDQEEEEYQYEFTKRKQRQEAELAESMTVKQKQLNEREAKMKETEDELAELRKMRDQWDTKLQKAVEEAVVTTAKNADTKYSHEVTLLKAEHQAVQSLLKQQVEYLQKQIATQTEEMKRLQKEAAVAGEYVTRIAERAVEKPASIVTPTNQVAK